MKSRFLVQRQSEQKEQGTTEIVKPVDVLPPSRLIGQPPIQQSTKSAPVQLSRFIPAVQQSTNQSTFYPQFSTPQPLQKETLPPVPDYQPSEFNQRFMVAPESRQHMKGGRPSEQSFGQHQSGVQADEYDVPMEFDEGYSQSGVSMVNASRQSIRSEQSFKPSRIARETVMVKQDNIDLKSEPDIDREDGPYVPIADQPADLMDPLLVRLSATDENAVRQRNLYRLMQYELIDDCATYKGLGNLHLLEAKPMQDDFGDVEQVWEMEQFCPVEEKQLQNRLYVTPKLHKLKFSSSQKQQLSQQRDSEVLAFKDPPLLMPYLANPLDYNDEMATLKALAQVEFDMSNESILEHKLTKFKLQMQTMLSKVKTKLSQAEKITEYLLGEWPYLFERYQANQQLHDTLVDRIVQFVLHAGVDEFINKHYIQLSAEAEEQSTQEQSLLRRVNQAYNFTLSTQSLAKNPTLEAPDEELTTMLEEMEDMQRLINEKYFKNVVERPGNLQTYFLWLHEREEYQPVFDHDRDVIEQCKQLSSFYVYLYGVGQRLHEKVCKFVSFLSSIRGNLVEQTQLFVNLASNFLKQCQEFETLFAFKKQCGKVILILQQGLSQLQAIKIPMCTERYRNFNLQLIDNANLKFLRAEQKITKYLQITLRTFPEELREEVVDERRRKDVVKYYKKQVDGDARDIRKMMEEPLMLAQRIECFTVCLQVRDEYLVHLKECQEVLTVFKQLPSIEVQLYTLQGEREVLKQFFLKTENRDILATQLEQVKVLKSRLIDIQTEILAKKWDAFNFKQVSVNYHVADQHKQASFQGSKTHLEEEIIEVEFIEAKLPLGVPHQIQRLIQWIQSELQAIDHLQQLHESYVEGYSEGRQLMYDRALWKTRGLVERVQAVIKYEPTVDEIISGSTSGSDEYKEVLRYVFETTVQPDVENDRLDYSRIQPTLHLDLELETHLDYLTQQKDDPGYAQALRLKFIALYDQLSNLYQDYTIWQNVQSCRFLMDGEVLSNIIKSTTLFPVTDEVPLPMALLSLPQAQEVMKRLMRGFRLNIKNSEHCVFFKIYLSEALRVVGVILAHFTQLQNLLKLNYNEKKQLKIEDVNAICMRECMVLIDDPQTSLVIIRDPLISGIKYYLDKNCVQFRTHGATMDWDKQIEETRTFMNEYDQTLSVASNLCEQIIRSSLLKHYQPPKVGAQSKNQEQQSKVSFSPEEFYMGTPQLLKLQQSKIKMGKVRVECENLINNQIDQQEYKYRFRYLIQVIDELLLWTKAIEKIARVAYMTMGKIKDVLEFDDSITQDYLRQMKLFAEEVNINIKEIKAIEMRSPFSFKNKVDSTWTPPPEFKVELQSAPKIDSQLLLVHKIAKMTVYLIDILQRSVASMLMFSQLTELDILIDEDFFDLLNRFVVFYRGAPKNPKRKVDELAEPVYDKSVGDVQFANAIAEIPDYCPFPKIVLQACLKSYEPLIETFESQFDMPTILDLNALIQNYMDEHEQPILSLAAFVSDTQMFLRIDTKGKRQLSRTTLVNFSNSCQQSETDLQEFNAFLTKLIVKASLPEIRNQKFLNKLKDEQLWRHYLDEEQDDWLVYLRMVPGMVTAYFEDLDKMRVLPYDTYANTLQINIKMVTQKSNELGVPKNVNYKLLLTLYSDFQVLFDTEYAMSSK